MRKTLWILAWVALAPVPVAGVVFDATDLAGADIGARVNTAYAALPSNGGGIRVPPYPGDGGTNPFVASGAGPENFLSSTYSFARPGRNLDFLSILYYCWPYLNEEELAYEPG